MIETGVFDFDSITFDDVADANKDAEPTTRKPDMNMEDVKPESRAAASPKAGGIFNSDISNTLASQHSPTHATEERPAKRSRFADIPKPRANRIVAPRVLQHNRSVKSSALSHEEVIDMVIADGQSTVRAKQRIIDQIREHERIIAVYKKDLEMIESIGNKWAAFRRKHPDLAKQLDIWKSYERDVCNMDTNDRIVCKVVRDAWEQICDNSGRAGPSDKVLQEAMAEMRRRNLACVTNTKAWMHWDSSQSSGAKYEEVIYVDHSLAKRFAAVRAGKIQPSRDSYEQFRIAKLEGAALESAQMAFERFFTSYDEHNQRKSIA